jgi:two-component system, cell cycle response regulator DivK
VEDNEMNRDMLSRRLQRRGFEMLLAVDGHEGMEKIAAEKPDLVLMDMSLPIVDGWDVTRWMKADPELKHIPVIALTAHAMTGDREQALSVGSDGYVTKPIDFPGLLEQIRVLLQRSATGA